MNNLKLTHDVIILPQSEDRWVAYNVFAKTSLGLDGRGLDALGRIQGKSADAALSSLTGPVNVWEVGRFSNLDGLMADPSRYIRDTADWPSAEIVEPARFLELLQTRFILIQDEQQYRSRFASTTSILDRFHFGNFHEQLGKALLSRKEDPSSFWYNQKFTPDFKSVRNNMYGAVQEHFLSAFIPERFGDPTLRVLDVACGTGYYTNKIAGTGVRVTGVDLNENSLSIARRSAPSNADFHKADMQSPDGLAFLGTQAFDLVFLSDALLFYFSPLDKGLVISPEVFFHQVFQALKPNGKLIIMEPHYLFWLAPWLGDEDHPFTIFTEYLNRKFMVTPPFSVFFQAAARGGFALTDMRELIPSEGFEKVDARAAHFAREFPLWHVFEFLRLNQPAKK